MEVDVIKWKNSLKEVRKISESPDELIEKLLRLSDWNEEVIMKVIRHLAEKIIHPDYTECIGREFREVLPLIVSEAFQESHGGQKLTQVECEALHRAKCVALSKLVAYSRAILRFSFKFFEENPSPFDAISEERPQKKRRGGIQPISTVEISKCCLRFLRADREFFRNAWKWSKFLQEYFNKGCDVQKMTCNEILGILTNMISREVDSLDAAIAEDVKLSRKMTEGDLQTSSQPVEENPTRGQKISWEFSSENVVNVEGVFLAVFDAENRRLCHEMAKESDRLILVESTRSNIRNICLGIGSGKAICLHGPVGAGKTTLVDELARKTGHISPQNGGSDAKSGFLRIQLGHQTDSKALLGQHRCTDIPGEFIWQPGVLTQAILSGYWLLLEDLDLATPDVCTVLTNLLENGFLSVPGFRENIRIAPGFQLFITLRSQRGGASSVFSLLEKHLFTVNILSLSREELCEIIRQKFPKLTTIAGRIVDVFLTFSKGRHEEDDQEVGTLTSGANSGRQVSTRDLLKLCKRSHPNFNVTSTECAYLVFQNSVDLLCSHLPDGTEKTQLIKKIGGKLGIIESRCQALAEDFKPEIEIDSTVIRVGRAAMGRWRNEEESQGGKRKQSPLECESSKKQKTDANRVKSISKILESSVPTFSFTRLASCLLERIAVSVQQNEPILLVGETGVGKTSAVQYLAHQTAHKLVVVNMNNQSDISDLVGGFKPVDLHYVVTPLFQDFQYLIRTTFDAGKNEKFLTSMTEAYSGKQYRKLVKAMLKVVEHTLATYEVKAGTQMGKKLRENWEILVGKLRKLSGQLRNSINMSFAFISGALVNCLKNGEWILLDEINLASTETLECLATILEPDGSIVLLEKGDYVPVERHPAFRLFACMNPSTDIGKKDLPVGIRNRFTEFFVDELKDVSDLRCLVGDYLKNTGIQTGKVMNVVELYRKLRKMARLELNDGLGNRPVYSLRTLCRALTICARNLCGSVERNLFESFCMSFLTQLDGTSHRTVLQLIQKTLLGSPERLKAVLGYQIPKPPGQECEFFEGYWIECGAKEPQGWETYILTESVRQNLKDLSRIISLGRLPVLLQGPTSAGKTSLIEYVARRSGNHCLRINNHEHTDLQEYIGTYTADVTGRLTFQEGVLVQAMRHGYWIILDELNLASSDILEALNRVLDDNRELFIPETQTLIKAHPNFMLFATQNPPGLYGGRKTLSRAFKNRFIELHFGEIPRDELAEILEKRCLIPKSHAEKMVRTMAELHTNRRNVTRSNFTLRDLFRWGNRYTLADKKLLDDAKYDWNQHLVDEGYLVLSAKVRNESDLEAIQAALMTNFRKVADLENLFNYHGATSPVTKDVLGALMRCPGSRRIHWSSDILKMYVQVAKALTFKEPVLLVGPTGCGKTTVCQLVAETLGKPVRILNCHMHTEAADFLGGLRPFRGEKEATKKQLFEWADGPLVLAMQEGTHFLADEISLADDSILERLNSILEPERTVLLAEKGGIDQGLIVSGANDDFIIQAHADFQFLATMNPGGDFGKKELSPALRNRFTEIWCTNPTAPEHLEKIALHHLTHALPEAPALAKCIVDVLSYMKATVDKMNFSVRDIVSWTQYILANSKKHLSLPEILFFGLETLFLDFLEMLPHREGETEKIRERIANFLLRKLRELFNSKLTTKDLLRNRGDCVQKLENQFGIHPFYIPFAANCDSHSTDFSFTAPTTKRNLFQLLSGLTLNKAILLEGAPGVGKTSLVVNLAAATGHKIVRINLCEHTDLADLFGTDLPADDHSLELFSEGGTKGDASAPRGAFVWRDGPLLAALKAEDTWILLDELNLAPQSVLEGLNAILDHRGEVFIPELNKTFKLATQTRIFASQNPLKQGGGRKGLPQSFLNRFTKVYLRKLHQDDLLHVIEAQYRSFFEKFNAEFADLPRKMVEFSQILDRGIESLEFGLRGGPFEINLRDILRWCDFVSNPKTGYHPGTSNLIQVIYEKMKIVYFERMRSEHDRNFIKKTFTEVFNVDTDALDEISRNVSFYWTDTHLYINEMKLERKPSRGNVEKCPLIIESQLETMRTMLECTEIARPILLCGPADCGKTKSIDLVCSLLNQPLDVDTIDDSVTGSFQQIDLNRHLEEVAKIIELHVFDFAKSSVLVQDPEVSYEDAFGLIDQWEKYNMLLKNVRGASMKMSVSDEVQLFRNRINQLKKVFKGLRSIKGSLPNAPNYDLVEKIIENLKKIADSSSSLNTGGHFEWVDSKIVKCLKSGHFVCLEHVNMCSSAILDRLNSVFESNGTLLLSEKGITSEGRIEEIAKHPEFRAFLTLDPKNGEISRAMRNRCLEIFLERDRYTKDDLRHIIYDAGVRNLSTIDAMIRIHERLKGVSEFSQFGVNHLFKFALLVVENQTLRPPCRGMLRSCAVEVYVRSTNVDILGFGLKFYRNRLEEEIDSELKVTCLEGNQVGLENVIIRSDKLTQMARIKLNCEPLLCLLKNPQQPGILHQLSEEFKLINFGNEEQFWRYLLFCVYSMSARDDVKTMRIYIDREMKKIEDSSGILKINEKIAEKINEFLNSSINPALPWNSRIFPRIRAEEKLDVVHQMRLLLLTMWHAFVNEIHVMASLKITNIDAITYSKAVCTNILVDSFDKNLLRNLYPFLRTLEDFFEVTILRSVKISSPGFFEMALLAMLWRNRLLAACSERICINKRLDDVAMNKIILHIKWLIKNLVNPLKEGENIEENLKDFARSLRKISTCILAEKHPLNGIRKLFTKKITQFLPLYEERDVHKAELNKFLEDHLSMAQNLRKISHEEATKRLKIITSREFLNLQEDFMKIHRKDYAEDDEESSQIEKLKEKLEEMISRDRENEPLKMDVVELIPILEYFAMKAVLPDGLKGQINREFFLQTKYSSPSEINLVAMKTDQDFAGDLARFIEMREENDLSEILKDHPDFYPIISTNLKVLDKARKQKVMNVISAKYRNIGNTDRYSEDEDYQRNGPLLTQGIFGVLLNPSGDLREAGFDILEAFKGNLKTIQQILWSNMECMSWNLFNLELIDYQSAMTKSRNLLEEVKYTRDQCLNVENENFAEFNTYFFALVDLLEQQLTSPQNHQVVDDLPTATDRRQMNLTASILYSLIGAIELNLLCHLPLLDPVEKHRLKRNYLEEDMKHLQGLSAAYQSMGIVCKYALLGHELVEIFQKKLASLEDFQKKLAKRLALRPEVCVYSELSRNIKHFLHSCCHPKDLHSLLTQAVAVDARKDAKLCNEIAKKFESWMKNSENFQFHILPQYSTHYRDFVEPIDYAVTLLKYGMSGIVDHLKEASNLAAKLPEKIATDQFSQVLESLIEFPDVRVPSEIQNIQTIVLKILLGDLPNGQELFLQLMKVKINETTNDVLIRKEVSENLMMKYNKILKVFARMWKKQEDEKKKRQIEEESLYVTNRKCETEDEDAIMQEEIEMNFPTTVSEDFGDLLQNDTLEQIHKKNKSSAATKKDVFTAEDVKIVAESFVKIMDLTESFRGDLTIDYLESYAVKVKVFQNLLKHFGNCLNSRIDDASYLGMGILVNVSRKNYDLSGSLEKGKEFNFYKDANVGEILPCLDVLNAIEVRTENELKQWPDHAALQDIITIVNRLKSFPVTSTIVRFSTGFQLLGKRLDEWNSVAHRSNNMLDLKVRTTEFIQRWTKLELQYWRECLTHAFERVKSNGYKYWFFIFNLIHEYMQSGRSSQTLDTFDGASDGIEVVDIMKTLNQFMETSNFAEFSLRLALLKAFEKFLMQIPGNDERKQTLIAVIFNIHLYFSQFLPAIEDYVKTKRQPIEKELKERVKIASYTPDLSYISMKNNIKEMHRKVQKCMKQFEGVLREKITPLLTGEEAKTPPVFTEKTTEGHLRYTIDVNNFLVAEKLKDRCEDSVKIFLVSRDLVKQTVLHSQYPSNILALEQLTNDYVEVSESLRKLEVDRSVERAKQKSQAKQILNQKRKSLADFFKTLASLGLSYRTGLMEFSLNPEVVDLKIQPFVMEDRKLKRKFNKNLISFAENVDGRFAKCCYRLKRLITTLQVPSSELGLQNTDRIKGFSVDLFQLMQKQRRTVSSSLRNLQTIQKSVENLVHLSTALRSVSPNDLEASLNFPVLDDKIEEILQSACMIRNVLEQFKLLLNSTPESFNQNLMALKDPAVDLTRNSDVVRDLLQMSSSVIANTDKLIEKINAKKTVQFHSIDFIRSCREDLSAIVKIIEKMKNNLHFEDRHLLIEKPLQDLLNSLENIAGKAEEASSTDTDENIVKEVENIMFSVRIAMQKLFKRATTFQSSSKDQAKDTEEDEDSPLLENHLKEAICSKLDADLADLNLQTIATKLERIILAVKYSTSPTERKMEVMKAMVEKVPILQQFALLAEYFVTQQVSVHRVSMKMLSLMLGVFVELVAKGFCIPQDLMHDIEEEEKQKEQGGKKGEGFGLEDGSEEKDVSDKIESEDQLEDAKKPGEEDKAGDEKEKGDCKEEKGIEMSEDFDSHLQDVDQNNEDDESEDDGEEDDADKQMGETEEGAEKLDDQIWGDEEGEDENEEEMNDDKGKGSDDTKETHDDLAADKEDGAEGNQDGLDAANPEGKQEKKQKQNEIDSMQEPEVDEDQINPYHNELEEPPEADPMDLGDGCNVDDDDVNENQGDEENPFDIDTMKEQVVNEDEEAVDEEEDGENKEKTQQNDSDSSDDDEDAINAKPESKTEGEDAQNDEENEEENKNEDATVPDQIDEEKDNEEEEENKDAKNPERPENHESKDAASKEDNVQAMPDSENKGSADQVAIEDQKNDQVSKEDIADQETGEDREGVGQAKNEESKSGHKGISEGTEAKTQERESVAEKKEKRKQGNTNEDRTLGDSSRSKRQLKTIEKMKETTDQEKENEDEQEAEEYQHVKDAKKSDRTTLDNATEEQAKRIQHEDEADEEGEKEAEDADNQLNDDDEQETDEQDVEMLDAEQIEGESSKPSKKDEKKQMERCEQVERGEIEGEEIPTMTAKRSDDTAAHCQMDIVQDTTLPDEPDVRESLEMRKMFHREATSVKTARPEQGDFEKWQEVSVKMTQNARDLCEQLRLILEPTKCTRMKGDYRTGRRINMKKIIPYLASQFRKDKIWLRRTKPAQRDYKITIAIDDSKSMHHNNSKELTLEAISLVSQALTLLESGKLSIVSFGESPQILLNHTDQFDGPKLVKYLNFEQNQSRIAELLNFIRTAAQEDTSGGSGNGIFENLLLILSDGRNIFSEGEQKVKDAVKLARLQRIFTVYVIIDNPDNKHSIMDIRVPCFSADKKNITMKYYLDTFPFPYYVIVRDLGQLPLVLSDAMRQWFELVSSES
ncbi:midasin [Lutzomyia longipalpis]|uniref:midasin n=1 Tax=Lutzomyia longipalpis TaxID=7200 RepID=UPI0024838872|nr:midasin [Lutzomyia longipalpis]